jgi:glycerol-3-phosphate dehydrogenase
MGEAVTGMKRGEKAALTGTTFDVLVIGGGITGTATARDAALRGLSVALVEKDDFAAGTSSRSSKLIHGGLRYLETYQFKLVAESLRERERALRTAPHLTEVRPFIFLLYDGYPESAHLLNLGLTFYDVASGAWRKRRHRMLSPQQILHREPHLARAGLRGGGLFYDVLTDDARLTIDTAKGAAEAGAVLANHTEVVELLVERGVARGATVVDRLTEETFAIHARQVLNATGPWTDRIRALEEPGKAQHRLRPTKGVHIALRRADFPLQTALFLRSPDDNRVVWPIPSLEDDVVYIGTTDTDYHGDLDDVHPEVEDVDYLLNVANHVIPGARVTRDHVVSSWAGIRPLVAPAAGVSQSNTSREHAIATGPTGMITISGGKLTSSRLMAKQLVDVALSGMSRRPVRSLAGQTPIAGGDRRATQVAHDDLLRAGVPSDLVRTWIGRYGSDAHRLLDIWERDTENREVIGVRGLTRAELIHLVENEMAVTLEDVLVRRTSAFFWDPTGGRSHVEAVADELERLAGWPPGRKREEIAAYSELVRKNRPGQADDPAAE